MPPLHYQSNVKADTPTSYAFSFTLLFGIAICALLYYASTYWLVCSRVLAQYSSNLCSVYLAQPTYDATDMRKMKVVETEDSNDETSQSEHDMTTVDDIEDPVNQQADGTTAPLQTSGWRLLLSFTSRTHILPLTIAVLLAIASGVVIPGLAYFLGKIFNSFTSFGANKLTGKDLVHKVTHDCIALAGLGAISWLLNGGYFMFWLLFGELQARNVRDKVFNGLLDKDLEWFEMQKSGVGALLPRLQTQIRELQLATSQPLGFAVQYTVTTFAALGLAFYTSWDLTLVTLATVPISALILSFLASKMQPSIEAQQAELNRASKFANNAISSIDIVKCFNGQAFETNQYYSAIKRAARCYLRQARSNALQIGFVRVMTLGMFVQGFWYGSSIVNSGKQSAGDVLTTFWACLIATQSIEQILPQMIVLEKGRAAAASLRVLLLRVDKGKKVNKMMGRITPTFCEGDIEVRKVTFSYPSRPDSIALDSATFFFPAGETTFVVGRSGSGKSTVGSLLMRFYSPKSGEIFIDGTSIETLDMNWLRNNITLVQQQSILFNESIFRNIAFGRRDYLKIRKEHIKKSIELAMLQRTINDMPHGLDTIVGNGGSALSGGQRQKIAIARAALRDTPILILDEPTSALDSISRNLVMDAVREWRQGKTTIIITHDMSQILEDDFVYVLENGRIIEEGYRRYLESLDRGKLTNGLLPTIALAAHPKEEQNSHSDIPAPSRSNIRDSLVNTFSRPAFKTKDSLRVRMRPQLITVPPSYGQQEEGRPYKRPSGGLLSPLSPYPYYGQPPSSANSPSLLSPGEQQILALISPSHLSPRDGIEMIEMHGRQSRISRIKNDINTLRGSKTLESTIARASRTARSRRRGRKPSEAEKERRIAPIKKILLTVWPNLRWKDRSLLIIGFIGALIHAAATPVFSWVFSKLLGTFFLQEHRSQRALVWSLSVMGVAFADAIASFLMHYFLEKCGQAWVDRLRVEAMKRVLDQPRQWFDRDKNSLSKLTVCLDRNAEEMRNLMGRFAGFIFVAAAMMGIAVVWSTIVCWKLTLVGLASAPALYAVTRAFDAVSARWERRSNDASEVAGSIFADTFSDIRTMRALTLESYFHKKYSRATSKAMVVGFKRSAYSGLFFGLSDSGIIFVTALIFYYGAILASSRHFSTQDILTVFSMLLFSMASVNAIVALIPQISSSRDTATRLLRLANLPLGRSHEHHGQLRISQPGTINFINLSFSYPSEPETFALHHFNLTIPTNTCTTIVGASGSGKSTIASLLMGLYSPSLSPSDPPSLTIGGRDIRTLDTPALRSLVAIVPQTTVLFPTSVTDNIIYGLPRHSPLTNSSNIRAAASAAGIDEFITTLPQAYNTHIGDGGMGLSGGQAQRIGIARALVRRPKILILDEATSSLDAESAKVVKQTVKKLVEQGQGLTVIIITHAKEMMSFADNVVVMDNGRVVEEGSLEVLLGTDGDLRKMLGMGSDLQ